jgi:hypothetical protein
MKHSNFALQCEVRRENCDGATVTTQMSLPKSVDEKPQCRGVQAEENLLRETRNSYLKNRKEKLRSAYEFHSRSK